MPTLTDTDREIWVNVGRRQVADEMKELLRVQDESGSASEGPQNVFPVSPVSGTGSSSDPDTGPTSATACRTPGSTGNRLGS